MFEQFVKRPFHLAQYRNGPYAEERSRFMERLVQQGRCVGRLKALNWLLEVAKRVDLSGVVQIRDAEDLLDLGPEAHLATTGDE